jgi:hypothetical protein
MEAEFLGSTREAVIFHGFYTTRKCASQKAEGSLDTTICRVYRPTWKRYAVELQYASLVVDWVLSASKSKNWAYSTDTFGDVSLQLEVGQTFSLFWMALLHEKVCTILLGVELP